MTDEPIKKPIPRNQPQPVRRRGRPRKEHFEVPAPEVDEDNPPSYEGELRTLKQLDIIEYNRRAESDFVFIVRNLLAVHPAMRVREVCIETAARLDCSIQTTKNYLLKHTASISEFSIEKGWVTERKKK